MAPAVRIRLDNGNTVTVRAGQPIPDELPDEHCVYLLPHEYIACLKDQQVYVSTKLGEWRRTTRRIRRHDLAGRRVVLHGATNAIREFLPRLDSVFRRYKNGDAKAEKEWVDFCTDCAVLLAYRAVVTDEPVGVLLHLPSVIGNKSAAMLFKLQAAS